MQTFFLFLARYFQKSCSIRYAIAFFVMACLCSAQLDAVYILVYSINTNGGLSWTGNTLGLNKASNQNQPGTMGSIGTFITTDSSLKVGNYPEGTTLDWTLNSSTAVLDIPAGSTILHAELIWSGSYGFDPEITGEVLNTPITFITPDSNSHSITPNPLTAQSRSYGTATGFYVRSADVTSLVAAQGAGTYTVGGVPATINSTENDFNCAGWTLAVAYANPQMFISNLTIFVGCEASGAGAAIITGFHAPNSGNISSRLFVSCLEGDAQLVNDHFLVGATPLMSFPDDAVSGANNPINNFFGSQINTLLPLTLDPVTGKLIANSSASLDTRGSFGTLNSNINTGTGVSGARQGYDITSVDISGVMNNGQETLYAQGATDDDVYTVNALGIQMQVSAPIIESQLEASPSTVVLNSLVTYTATFTNIGEVTAESLVFTDPLPSGLVLEPNTFTVNGNPVVDPDLVNGVPLGDLPVNETITVTFQARVTQANPPSSFDNSSLVSYTFTPINSPAGATEFTSQTNVVTVSVLEVPPPQANPDTAATSANMTLTGTSVLANDTGTDITVTAYDAVSAEGGSVTMQANGTFLYDPPTGFSGIDTFNYTITDSIGQTSSTTVTITVEPVAVNNTASVAANTTLNQTESVLNDDIGTGLFVSSFDNPSAEGGSVTMQSNGTYVYTPPVNFSGIDTFNYEITDQAGNTAVGVVTITVLPRAVNDTGSTLTNTPLNGITLFVNDIGTGITLVSYDHQSTQGGQVTVRTNGTYTYIPPSNFSGTDTFTYTIQDQNGSLSIGTVTINVLPVAVNDAGTTTANTTLNQITSVLNNDRGTGLSVTTYSHSTLQGGTVVVQPNGTYTYIPPLNFSGSDTFTYTATDEAGLTTSAQVIITVLPKLSEMNETVVANSPLAGSSVLKNAVGTMLRIVSFQSVTDENGRVVMNSNGTYTYTPLLNFSGLDHFTYTARDAFGNTSTSRVTISVLPLGTPNIFTTKANQPLQGLSVLNNDIGTNLTIVSLKKKSEQGGSITMQPDGTFTYTPPINFSGNDTFTYTATDASNQIMTASVTINVLPSAFNDRAKTIVNIPLNGSSVLTNDIGTGLKISHYDATSTAGGLVSMNRGKGTYTYTPPQDFIGIDSFIYTVIDAAGNTATATVRISVLPLAPPSHFTGSIDKCEFLNKTKYHLKARWSSSLSSNVVAYRIYYAGRRVAQIPAGAPLVFHTCLKSKTRANAYEITAVNSGGAESIHVKIRINNE